LQSGCILVPIVLQFRVELWLYFPLDIRPGNGDGLFGFRRFINLSLTYLLRHLLTYLQPRNPHKPTLKSPLNSKGSGSQAFKQGRYVKITLSLQHAYVTSNKVKPLTKTFISDFDMHVLLPWSPSSNRNTLHVHNSLTNTHLNSSNTTYSS